MRAIVTAVVAAIEACAAAVVGLLAVAIPVVLTWVVTFDIAAEPSTVAGIVSGVWLLSHFVPLHFTIAQEGALALGLEPEAFSFALSLAPLGITLITALFAGRAGTRLARRGGTGAAGLVGGAAGFGVVAWVAAWGAEGLTDWPLYGRIGLPVAVYVGCALAAYVITSAVLGQGWWRQFVRALQRGLENAAVPGFAAFPRRVAAAFRLAAAMSAGLIGLAAAALAVAFAAHFADVIAIAQALQLDGFGSVLLFLVQLALVPVGVIWSIAWLSGSGFHLVGDFSPFAGSEAMLPSLPMLGALPHSWGSFGALAPALIVLLGVAIGMLLTRRSELRRASWAAALAAAAAAAAITGLVVALLCLLAGGDLGPGSLTAAGPLAWRTAGLVAGLSCVGLCAGVAIARVDYARLQQQLPEPLAKLAAARSNDEDLQATGALTVDLSAVAGLDDGVDTETRAGVGRAARGRARGFVDPLEESPDEQFGEDLDGRLDGGLHGGLDGIDVLEDPHDEPNAGREAAANATGAADDSEPAGAQVIDLFAGVMRDESPAAHAAALGGGYGEAGHEDSGDEYDTAAYADADLANAGYAEEAVADEAAAHDTVAVDPDDTVPVEAFDHIAEERAEAAAAAAREAQKYEDSDAILEAFAWDADVVAAQIEHDPAYDTQPSPRVAGDQFAAPAVGGDETQELTGIADGEVSGGVAQAPGEKSNWRSRLPGWRKGDN